MHSKTVIRSFWFYESSQSAILQFYRFILNLGVKNETHSSFKFFLACYFRTFYESANSSHETFFLFSMVLLNKLAVT